MRLQPVTDDPRDILRESRAAARTAESQDATTPVSSTRRARRPRASSFGAARNVSDETWMSDGFFGDASTRARDDDALRTPSESETAPRVAESATEAPPSARRASSLSSSLTTLIGAREFARNSREAAASLDAPALGLAKPSEAERDALRETARVLPDGSGGAHVSCEWRLREDEVVLVLGCVPPPAKYFGITPYVYKSYDAGIVRTLFASAGDTLAIGGDDGFGVAKFSRLGTSAGRVPETADGTLGVLRDVACWNATFAAAFGGHRHTLRDSIDVFANAARGASESALVPRAADAANAYGLSRQTGIKTRALMLRHAVPSDSNDWAAYASNPPFVVMRLTPRRPPIFPAPFPRASLIPRKTFDEQPLASSVALVADRVAAYFLAGGGGLDGTTLGAEDTSTREIAENAWFDVPGTFVTQTLATRPQVLFDNGQRCLDVSWNCGGDNRDTTYVNGPRFRLPDDAAVAYVVGVNHAATGNAVYANVAVYDPARKLGVIAVDDGAFENTADGWTRGTPAEGDASSLFVIALARKCPRGSVAEKERNADDGSSGGRSRLLDGTLCVEVPSDGFPSASPNAELAVWERPYCHAETTVGPWWSRLATPTVVLVRRVGDAPSSTPFPFDVNTF